MKGRIFISYSRKDLDAVKPIKEELEANGFSCWMDMEGIESGSPEFTKTIVKAINADPAFLPQDLEDAFRMCRLSAKPGWHWAQYRLGECYEKGLETYKNPSEA